MSAQEPGFNFTVYDDNDTARKISSTGLRCDPIPDRAGVSYWMLIRPEERLISLPYEEILVDFACHREHREKSEEELPAFRERLRRLFCVFVQGAVIGWNVTEDPSEDLREYEVVIPIHKWLAKRRLDEVEPWLLPSRAEHRQMCKADILAFYLKKYRDEGALALHPLADLPGSVCGRMPYGTDLIKGVRNDIGFEGFLDGHMTAQALERDHVGPASDLVKANVRDVYNKLRSIGEKEGWITVPQASAQKSPRAVNVASTGKAIKSVFIGHGQSRVWRDLKDLLRDRLKLEHVEFNSIPPAGFTTTERLKAMLNSCDFAFIVMTAEDEHSDGKKHARQNVVHELGLFQAQLGFERAIILLEEGCEQFSNIHGLTHISFPKGKIQAASEEIRKVLERENTLSG